MVGIGYDIHRLAEGESLVIGGVNLDYHLGTVAHSDGDVLVHAIMDAILGAASLGDIGEHFPDNDQTFSGANSLSLLRHCCSIVENIGLEIINIDATLIMEKPRIKPHKEIMKQNIAFACGIETQRINIKATTNERIGAVGREEGAAAMAVCQLEKKKD